MCLFAAPAVAATGAAASAIPFGAASLGIAAPSAFVAPTIFGAGAGAAATTAATGGLFGLGSAVSNQFLASLGLNLATGLVQQQAATQAANAIYQPSLIANQSAEDAFRDQQDGLAERLKETKKSKAQEKFAANIEALQAKGKTIASERAGLTIDILLADQERQSANFREAINQSVESASRQFDRDVKAVL